MKQDLVLKVKKLGKNFGGLLAVNSFTFEVTSHEIVGLIGPNGAGKTTVFNMISGVIKPDKGSVIFEGKEITGLSPHQIAQAGIGRTFQITRLFPKMTLIENLIVASRADNKKERALELLKLADLFDLKDEYASDISFGQQKLLSLCRILTLNPKLILLDEPAAGVNPTLQNKIMNFICNLREEGTAFLIVEHDMNVIKDYCDRVVVLSFGEKLAEGSYEEIRDNEKVLEAYFGR